LNKLRHLSIISLASKCKTIPYSLLLSELEIKNVRELEDLIIEAFYAEIIKGKLDQQNAQLEIEFAIGRDVTDDEIDEILNILNDWYFFVKNFIFSILYFKRLYRRTNCADVLKTIESEILYANTYKHQQLEIQNNIEAEVSNFDSSVKIVRLSKAS
jgi:COP9 signalosome complex subunit 7